MAARVIWARDGSLAGPVQVVFHVAGANSPSSGFARLGPVQLVQIAGELVALGLRISAMRLRPSVRFALVGGGRKKPLPPPAPRPAPFQGAL